MPLVRIALRQGKSATYRRAVADSVHAALVEVVRIPPDDRFQVVSEHDADGLIINRTFLGIERSDDAIVVEITLRRGRPTPLKEALYQRIVDRLADDPGVRPEDVLVTLIENDLSDWSFGKGVAQYVKNPPAPVPVPA